MDLDIKFLDRIGGKKGKYMHVTLSHSGLMFSLDPFCYEQSDPVTQIRTSNLLITSCISAISFLFGELVLFEIYTFFNQEIAKNITVKSIFL